MDLTNNKKKINIEFHADDYGLFPTQSHRILDCHRNGNLNGISVMPNSPYLSECMSDMYQFSDDVAVTVHLNLFEGKSLCRVPLLTDGEGNLNCSFGALLLRSFLPGRRKYRQQLKQELSAQIRAVQKYYPEELPVRLDGHAHYHMIPVVFDAMMDVIREENLKVSYIRIPREYLSVYLPCLSRLQDFSPINLAKVLILNLLSLRAETKYRDTLQHMQQKLFLGVFLSGRMYYENVIHLLPGALALAERKGMDLEILGHPGGVFEEADIAEITSPEDREFLTDQLRNREKSLYLINL
jgi:predicted glycoside hydrolase/deacetylase ChbG (UPF0249 family)